MSNTSVEALKCHSVRLLDHCVVDGGHYSLFCLHLGCQYLEEELGHDYELELTSHPKNNSVIYQKHLL